MWGLKCPTYHIFFIHWSSGHLVCRKCARRTRRWRCWWTRWETCCGTWMPCWPSGNDELRQLPVCVWNAGTRPPGVLAVHRHKLLLLRERQLKTPPFDSFSCCPWGELHWTTSHSSFQDRSLLYKWQLTSVFFLPLPAKRFLSLFSVLIRQRFHFSFVLKRRLKKSQLLRCFGLKTTKNLF